MLDFLCVNINFSLIKTTKGDYCYKSLLKDAIKLSYKKVTLTRVCICTCAMPDNAGSQSVRKFGGRAVPLGPDSCKALMEGKEVGTMSVSPVCFSCASADTGTSEAVEASWEPDKLVVGREV